MANYQKYSCTNELGAEFLVIITSIFITITVFVRMQWDNLKDRVGEKNTNFNDEDTNLFLSLAYALILPLMSYLFSQAKQYYSEGRAQVILIWMVFIEIIRVRGDPIFTWRFRKSAEQLVRLFWVSFLIYSYTSLNGIGVNLFILCVYFAFSEVMKGFMFKKAKNSYLIGNNPNLIHNYLLKDDLQITPLENCGYIVFGEENYEIFVQGNGYILGEKKPYRSKSILTIGRVFQLSLQEDKTFTSAHPEWRDNCLSFALAKILRCRFAKLSFDEAYYKKALNFVLEGLIDYVGHNRDIQTDKNSEERNPIQSQRVFHIIQDELNYVSNFLEMRVPILYFYPLYHYKNAAGLNMVIGSGVYLIYTIWKKISAWLSFVAQDENRNCFFQTVRGYALMKIFSRLDQSITILLYIACLYVHCIGSWGDSRNHWYNLNTVEDYIHDPAEWSKTSTSKKKNSRPFKQLKPTKIHPTVLDIRRQKIFFCLKVNWSTILSLPKWARRSIPIAIPTVHHSSDTKDAILTSLRKSGGQLTNAETSVKNHGMEHLNWACKLHNSTTEVIMVWHIATTLFHHSHLNKIPSPTNQEQSHPQSDNSLKKQQQVALELSSYCHHLVAYRPQLLPDEVEWTKDMYEGLRKDILAIDDKSSDQKHTKDYRCNYALKARWTENSVIGKGVKLAEELMQCAEVRKVWEMLADFWVEMMLFIAPSDNVEGHQEILVREELITQLWALLTHAGILSRPKPTAT